MAGVLGVWLTSDQIAGLQLQITNCTPKGRPGAITPALSRVLPLLLPYSQTHVQPLIQRFRNLDEDGNGTLSLEDLQFIVKEAQMNQRGNKVQEHTSEPQPLGARTPNSRSIPSLLRAPFKKQIDPKAVRPNCN